MRLLLVFVLAASAGVRATEESASTELLLQHPLAYDAPANRCAPPMCTKLVEWLDEAETHIDFAIYGARRQTRILQALVNAKKRGVLVRGYVDRSLDGSTYYASTDEWARVLGSVEDDQMREQLAKPSNLRAACKRPSGFNGPLQCLAYDLGDSWLLAEHVSREDFVDPAKGSVNKIMHNKFFVIDRRRVWTGSANISDSGTGGYNANVVLAVESNALGQAYTEQFEYLLAREEAHGKMDAPPGQQGAGKLVQAGDAEISVWFAPRDKTMEEGVRPLLAAAKDRIDLAVFFLTHKRVTADLIAAHRRGVQVRIIVDATSAGNGYSKHELLRAAGIPTKVENWGSKMHAKAAVIDDEFLVLGSMNWTSAGEGVNDENTLLVRSPRLAADFTAWFESIWEDVPHAWLAENARPDPESRDSGSACTDGVDNDFDRLADGEDPGCSRNPPALQSLPPHRLMRKVGTEPPRSHRLYKEQAMCSMASPHALLTAAGRCLDEPSTQGDFRCGSKRSCGEMTSCAEARFFLEECGLSRLDGNRDGVPCERICR